MVAGQSAEPDPEYRLYQDLAGWWPLISPPGEYAAEAAYLSAVLCTADIPVREVLDLGSGGGHVASHLAGPLDLTLVDRSADMLATSRRLNPGCAHIRGDMRTLRLGRVFDAVLVHDAIDYVTTEADLSQVIETAFAHCRPGGLAVFVPDYTAETFQPGSGGGGSTAPDGRQGSFREWRSDPDPADDWIEVRYEFVLRARRRQHPGGPGDPPARCVPPRQLAPAAGRGRVHRGGGQQRRGAPRAAARAPVHRPRSRPAAPQPWRAGTG